MGFSKIQLPVLVRPIDLGKIITDDPSKDVHRYIEFDEIEILATNEAGIVLKIGKFHIQDYPLRYCKTCLQDGIKNEGIKNEESFASGSDGSWCKDHYAMKVRRESPQDACPNCDKGCLLFGTGNMYCSHCDHVEPHKHGPIKPGGSSFMCTCNVGLYL